VDALRAKLPRIQPVELALLGALLLVSLLYFNSGQPALGTLAALVFAIWLVSRVAPYFFLRRLAVSRAAPDTAFQDDTVAFSFRLRSAAGTAARFFSVEDANPAAWPEGRAPRMYVAECPTDREIDLAYERPLYKRGVYAVGPAVARCGFPLGVVEIVREIPDSTRTLHVLPRVYPLRRLPLAGLNLGRPDSILVARGGGDQTFLGVREYQRGDSPRHIHWASTAKHRTLMVKEFESQREGRVSIVLDLDAGAHAGEGRDTTFEYLASAAASVAAFALENRQSVELLGWQNGPYLQGPVTGSARLGLLLRALAEVEPRREGVMPFADCVGRIAPHFRDGGSVVCIFSDLNEARVWSALAALERRNLEVCAVVLRAGTFDKAAKGHRYSPPQTIPAVYVAQGGDLSVQFGG
jgi:uncharacterized protein (DUF58 family)